MSAQVQTPDAWLVQFSFPAIDERGPMTVAYIVGRGGIDGLNDLAELHATLPDVVADRARAEGYTGPLDEWKITSIAPGNWTFTTDPDLPW